MARAPRIARSPAAPWASGWRCRRPAARSSGRRRAAGRCRWCRCGRAHRRGPDRSRQAGLEVERRHAGGREPRSAPPPAAQRRQRLRWRNCWVPAGARWLRCRRVPAPPGKRMETAAAGPGFSQATSTVLCVVRKSLKMRQRGFDDNSSPSAKTPSRDILFLLLTSSRKPAERGHSRQIVRTMRTGWRAHFGPFAVSLAPLSPKQPNHGRFGTVVRSLPESMGYSDASWAAGLKVLRSGEVSRDRTTRFSTDAVGTRTAPRGCSWR